MESIPPPLPPQLKTPFKGAPRKRKALALRTSLSVKHNCHFPVTRLRRKMRLLTKRRVGENTAAALAKVLDDVVARIFQYSGDMTKHHKRKLITPRSIFIPFSLDMDFGQVSKEAVFAFSGTHEHIHAVLKRPYKGRFVENPGRRRRATQTPAKRKVPMAAKAPRIGKSPARRANVASRKTSAQSKKSKKTSVIIATASEKAASKTKERKKARVVRSTHSVVATA